MPLLEFYAPEARVGLTKDDAIDLSGPASIKTDRHDFADWRVALATAPNGRRSSTNTSGPFRSAAMHRARPRSACPARRHQGYS